MAKVFVSYSRKDTEFAKKLTGELQKNELDFWIDWEGIPPTVDWWREIEKGIEEADVFLFIISPDSATSKICGQEIDAAVKNGKRIIPIVTREIEWEDTPPQLGHLNYIFFSREDDFDTATNKLLTAIQTDYEWAATHRRLQVKALEWERNQKENGYLLRGKDLQDAEQQLAINTSKEPHPTDLQREHLFASRKATDRQRRILTGISVVGIIALAGLAIFGFIQAGLATNNAETAQANLVVAQTAEVKAQNNQVLADNNAATAVANEEEAKKQATIALARQLVSQAQVINLNQDSNQMVASLLSIQSLKLYPNGGDAASFLINDNQSARLIHRIESDYLDHSEIFALSPDGKYMALAGCEEEYEGESVCRIGNLRILEIATGTEVASVSPEGGVRSLAFSPDGKFVATAGCEVFDSEALHCSRSYARLWEVTTGKEAAYITPFAILGNILFSPDGRWLASDDGLLWDVVHLSSEPIFLEEDDSSIYSLAFSPDGNYVAVGYSENLDNTARVLETSTGKEVARVEHDGLVGLVAFSPDGKYVASAEYLHGIVIVWEAATGNEVARMTHEDNILSSVTFSPDGKYLAIGVGGTARVWEIATSLEVARTNFGVGSVAFSPDGKYVVSAVDTSARVWEAATGVEVVRMTHPANVTFAAFSPVALPGSGAGVIVSGSSDGTVLIWGIVLGRDAISLAHDGPVLSAAFSQDGKYIASAGCDQTDNEIDICNQGSVQIWEAPTGIEVERILHDNYLNSVTFTFDGKFVSASSENTTVFVWESASGKEVARITPDGGLDSFVISPDGKYVVTHMNAYSGIPPVVWDVPTGKEVTRLGEKGVFSIAFSPDGKYVSTGNDVWEAATGEVVGHIDDESFFQFSTAFSPDGKYVALGSWVGVGESTGGENIARVWEVATGIEVARMTYDFGVETVAFSPDGKYVVSGGGETARVWVAATGAEVSRMTHDGSVSSVAFSPDGKYVLSRGSDGTALLGEADTGMEVARITSASGVISAAFSPDGKYMLFVSVYGDAHVMLWQADDLIINACESMSRNLTRAEWAQYIGDVLPYQAVCEKLPIEPEITSTPTVAP